jgi:hypothetical protein
MIGEYYTYQLANQIQKLIDNPFEEKTYSQLKLKVRNLTIYPIIIYTDSHFMLPGIGNYLQESFSKIISEMKLSTNFKSVKNLSFIDIDFLIAKINILQEKKFTLDKMIDISINEQDKRRKRFSKTNSISDLLLINEPFESLCSNHLIKFDPKSNYVQVLFDELGLGRGL